MALRVKFKLYHLDGKRSRLEFSLTNDEHYFIGALENGDASELTFGLENPACSFGYFSIQRDGDQDRLRFRPNPERFGKVRLKGTPITTERPVPIERDDHMIFDTTAGSFRVEFLKIRDPEVSEHTKSIRKSLPKKVPASSELEVACPRDMLRETVEKQSSRTGLISGRERPRKSEVAVVATDRSDFTATLSRLRDRALERPITRLRDEKTGATRVRVNPVHAVGLGALLIALAFIFKPFSQPLAPESTGSPLASAPKTSTAATIAAGVAQPGAEINYYPIGLRNGVNTTARRPEEVEADVANAVRAGAVDLLAPLFAEYTIRGDAKLSSGTPLIILAARSSQPAVIRYLVSKGADINTPDAQGMTALMYAVQSGSLETTQACLELNADSQIRRGDGQTAVHLASAAGKLNIIELLASSPTKSADRLPASSK